MTSIEKQPPGRDGTSAHNAEDGTIAARGLPFGEATMADGELPAFVRALREIALYERKRVTQSEAAVLNAAVRWVNFETGILWPSMAEWAKQAHVSERGLQGILKKLIGKGIVLLVSGSKGGRGRTARYQIPALAVDANPAGRAGIGSINPAVECGVSTTETPNPVRANPAPGALNPEPHALNPERGALNPAQLVRTNIQEQPRNNQGTTTVGGGGWAIAEFQSAWSGRIPAQDFGAVAGVCGLVEGSWGEADGPGTPEHRRGLWRRTLDVTAAEKGGVLGRFPTAVSAAKYANRIFEGCCRTGMMPGEKHQREDPGEAENRRIREKSARERAARIARMEARERGEAV